MITMTRMQRDSKQIEKIMQKYSKENGAHMGIIVKQDGVTASCIGGNINALIDNIIKQTVRIALASNGVVNEDTFGYMSEQMTFMYRDALGIKPEEGPEEAQEANKPIPIVVAKKGKEAKNEG